MRGCAMSLLAGAVIGLAALAVVLMTLGGCAPTSSNMPLGSAVAAPQGAVDYCKRNPKDEKCLPR